jgi:Fic family protein
MVCLERKVPVTVVEAQADANSRLTAIRLTMLTLRAMERWRSNVGDYDSAMVLVAVAAITGERLTRAELDPGMRSLAEVIPERQLATCSVSSIAAATGLNRETARRKVKALVDQGFLVKAANGSISFKAGHVQQEHVHELVRTQLDALVRTINDLCRDGTLLCDG